MATEHSCPHCGGAFRIAEDSPEPEYLCPHCGGRVIVGAPAPAPAAPATGAVLKRACPACGVRYASDRRRCPGCGAGYRESKIVRDEIREGRHRNGFEMERAGVNLGVLGGLLMIGLAAAWFFVGLAAGWIFFYPPILAAIGLFALLKGLFTGNLAGGRARRVRTRSARRPRGPRERGRSRGSRSR